jgi:N-acetylglucosamine malate deacetylase 1
MRLRFENDSVLAVVAHPDDAELLCAGTLARARKDGATIAICVLCRGDKGQPSNKIKKLVRVRKTELKASAEMLGAQVFEGNYADGTLMDTPATRSKVVEIYRKFRPTLVLAHAPEDYHPDHRAASALAEAASWLCASRGYGTRWPAIDSPPALWWMDTVNMGAFAPGFYIDISEFVDLKKKMLACHQSQLVRDKDSDFTPLLQTMQLQFRARGMQAGVQAAEAFRAHLVFKRARAW